MKKIYTALLALLPCQMIFAQCPIIRGAVINGCGTEGLNELVLFTTTVQATAGDYTLYFGSTNPPANITPNPTALLPGSKATTKNGTGTIISLSGCTIVYVTSPATVIPANSAVIFIPSNFTNNFTIPTCPAGNIYVVLINIVASPSIWSTTDNFSNDPGAATPRYLQVVNGATNCASEVRSYVSGWTVNAEGNAVAWDETGAAIYASLGCNILPLPVKLVSFTAVGSGNNSNIAWQTAGEVNAKSFELERSSNGTSFTTIASIPATGQSSEAKRYTYIDASIPSGTVYYRLKMIDKDGSITYSPVAKVTNGKNGFALTNLYPKPAVSQLTLTWTASSAGTSIVTVYDLTGKTLFSKQMPTATGMNNTQLPVSKLPKGQYILKLTKDGETAVTQFSKQ